MPNWYPLRFTPILKEKIWGGHKLFTHFGKTDKKGNYGESWEVSTLTEGESIVANGILKGHSFKSLCKEYPETLLGDVDSCDPFPLLIKIIDAAQDLSIQLHPDDQLAQEKHKCLGKTEMWYILKADPGAQIAIGFNKTMTPAQFDEAIVNNQLESVLNYIDVTAGDAFFVNAGTIHAIGKGVVLAEIQQASDITYRVFDYNRKQTDGTLRELHLAETKIAIQFNTPDFELKIDNEKKGVQPLKHTPFFKTDIVHISRQEAFTVPHHNTFSIIIVVRGSITIQYKEHTEDLTIGQTLFIPAACHPVAIVETEAAFLQVYL